MDCGRSGEEWKQRERERIWWLALEGSGGGGEKRAGVAYALDRQATGLERDQGCGRLNHLSSVNPSHQSLVTLQGEYKSLPIHSGLGYMASFDPQDLYGSVPDTAECLGGTTSFCCPS